MSNFNLLNAITTKNIVDFEIMLKLGWTPPKIEQRFSGNFNDLMIWSEILSRDWDDWLKLLGKYLPSITYEENILEMAFSHNAIECIKILWPHHNNIDNKKITKRIILSLENEWKTIDDFDDTIQMLEMLKSKGVDIYQVIEGDFEYGDLRTEGHNFWTRALFLSNWKIVNHFWPMDEKWKKWPRVSEMMIDIMEKIVGDTPAHLEQINKKHENLNEKKYLLRWIEDFGSTWVEEKYEVLFPKPHDFFIQENADERFYFHLSKPAHLKIAPWFRLPLYFNEEERKIIWKVWNGHFEKFDEEDGNDLLWLKTLSLNSNDEDVLNIIDLAEKDNAPWIKYWDEKTKDGVTSKDIFTGNF